VTCNDDYRSNAPWEGFPTVRRLPARLRGRAVLTLPSAARTVRISDPAGS
jgi:hypothetical protein